jgi:cell division protease FtsH
MALDAWLPVGFRLPDGSVSRLALFEGADWQVLEVQGKGRALVAHDMLARRWLDAGLIEPGSLMSFDFGDRHLWSISSSSGQVLCPVPEGKSPDTKAEAMSFALALRATRERDSDSPLQDALYVEKISRLLPTYSISSRTEDEVVLGYWLTGGASISAKSFRRLRQTMSWLGAGHLKDIVESAGFAVSEVIPTDRQGAAPPLQETPTEECTDRSASHIRHSTGPKVFELAVAQSLLSSLMNMSLKSSGTRIDIRPWVSTSLRQWFYTAPPAVGRRLRLID